MQILQGGKRNVPEKFKIRRKRKEAEVMTSSERAPSGIAAPGGYIQVSDSSELKPSAIVLENFEST